MDPVEVAARLDLEHAEWLARVKASLDRDRAALLRKLSWESRKNGRKTHCIRGHRLALTGVPAKKHGKVYTRCLACQQERKRKP